MPETRTVKGFSEVSLPLAEGDFESAPLWPLRYLSVCWFWKSTLQLYHILFGFASVLQNFIIRYLNVFVRTRFVRRNGIGIGAHFVKISLPDAGKNHSPWNPIPKSIPEFFPPVNPSCQSGLIFLPSTTPRRMPLSAHPEPWRRAYTFTGRVIRILPQYSDKNLRLFRGSSSFYRVDFVGERRCLLYLRTVNVARDFYAFCVSCTIGTGTAERVLVQPSISRLLYPSIYGILLPAQKLIFPSA